jgi:hypothetical protein
MRRFNARRKLKGAVLSAVASSKWGLLGDEELPVDHRATSRGNKYINGTVILRSEVQIPMMSLFFTHAISS